MSTLTRSDLHTFAERLYDFCPYPAVKYKVLTQILDLPPEDDRVRAWYPQFLKSDIVEELFETQDKYGGWGKLQSKDYSAKDKIPTSATGISRCLYIGLQYDDRDILFNACGYLEEFLTGHSREKFVTTNERGIPCANCWNRSVRTMNCVTKRTVNGCTSPDVPTARVNIPTNGKNRPSMMYF